MSEAQRSRRNVHRGGVQSYQLLEELSFMLADSSGRNEMLFRGSRSYVRCM